MGIDLQELLKTILAPSIVSAVIAVLGIYSGRALQKAQARKLDKEADKVESDSKVETTERLIQAAGSLVEQYSNALSRFKQEELDYISIIDTNKNRISNLEDSMESVKDKMQEQQETIVFLLKTNRELAAIGTALFRGVEILIKQLNEANIEPAWKPTKEIYDKLSTLEEFKVNGYRTD